MIIPSLLNSIDHLVYCVFDLEAGIDFFKEEFGLVASLGGRHLNEGTKNALITLDNQCYLELLAIDQDNSDVKSKRWMGIDQLSKEQITRWSIRSEDLNLDKKFLEAYNPQLGKMIYGKRTTPELKDLEWSMSKPLSSPEVEIAPFLIDWANSESHPTDELPIQGQLMQLKLTHPAPTELNRCLNALGVSMKVEKKNHVSIRAVIKGPKGTIEI